VLAVAPSSAERQDRKIFASRKVFFMSRVKSILFLWKDVTCPKSQEKLCLSEILCTSLIAINTSY